MGKGSVGLGLATRQISISTCEDRKVGKSSAFFLLVAFSLLISNIVVSNISGKFKHILIDNTFVVTDALSVPVAQVNLMVSRFKSMWDIQENNEMLAAENKRLMEWYQTANRLDAENKALRELLNMTNDEFHDFKSGKVLVDSKTQYSQTILVRLGENDGLTKGQGVLSHEGLIGRVIETGKKTSRVLLLSDVNSRIPVTIDGEHARAILAGTNNGDPILDHLPEDNKVIAGQKIITSGHGGVFPYGVPVGETYINDNGQMAVRAYADPSRSNYVQVVDYGVPAGSTSRSVASNSSSILR